MIKIKELRQRAGIKQQDLAQKLHYSQVTIAKWEQPGNFPRAYLLPELAKIFGVSIDDLFDPLDYSIIQNGGENHEP